MSIILGFAGSNSNDSINYKFVQYTCQQLQHAEVKLLNMAHYPFPMYSIDLEKEQGFSNALIEFKELLGSASGLVLSVSEHNSLPSAYFKNLLDWLSRIERHFLENTKVLLLSTSPGKRGGSSALDATKAVLPRFGAEVVAHFSLPSFGENFDSQKGVLAEGLHSDYQKALTNFKDALSI